MGTDGSSGPCVRFRKEKRMEDHTLEDIEKKRDPERILKQIKAAEENQEALAAGRRGRLKIFFGYAAGVGKTYAMLDAARTDLQAGRDVVAGYIEPHASPETMALTEGVEMLPIMDVEHRGIHIREFDLDGALARRPELILVDEMAHTNAEVCRHRKRWQDIQELLDAGIDVYTTVNVQHLESLHDIVASITHIRVSERVPDRRPGEPGGDPPASGRPAGVLYRGTRTPVHLPGPVQREGDPHGGPHGLCLQG